MPISHRFVLTKDFKGDVNRVLIPKEKWPDLTGNVLPHNHPGGWRFPADNPRHAGSSFSIDDVALIAHFGLVELRAVSPGYTHILRQSPDPRSVYSTRISGSTYENVFQRAFPVWSTVTVALQVRVDDADDQFSLDDLAMTRPHLVMLELSEQWGLEYQREEFP